MAKDILFAAFYGASSGGTGVTGLTVTLDVWRVTLSSLSASEIVTAGSATEIGDGLYAYRYASADLATYYYYAVFKTSDTTVTAKHLPAAQLDFSQLTGDAYARLGAPTGASVSADIASVASGVTTLVNRLGAFTGSGINTVLGFLKAIMSKASSLTPSDVGGTFDNTTDALEAIKDGGTPANISDADMTTIAGRVWNNTYASTRTLTQSAASVAAAVEGALLTLQRGDSWSATLTGLSSNSGYSKIWFTVKQARADADTDALIQILLTSPAAGTDGLQRLNGASATAAQGSITVNSSTSLTIALDEAATAQLTARRNLVYDIQYLISNSITTATDGNAVVTADVTRAVS